MQFVVSVPTRHFRHTAETNTTCLVVLYRWLCCGTDPLSGVGISLRSYLTGPLFIVVRPYLLPIP